MLSGEGQQHQERDMGCEASARQQVGPERSVGSSSALGVVMLLQHDIAASWALQAVQLS